MAADTKAKVERQDALSEVLADSWWAVGLRGIIAVAFALICLIVPGGAILALVLFFSAYMLVDGVFALASGIKAARNGERWGLLILEGIVDLAAGAIAFLWPQITALAFVILIGVWAIISGALMLGAALTLKLNHGRWWLALGAIASIVFGILLLVSPIVGAVVLTWWIGAYAIVFGVMLLVLAFQLHGKKEERETGASAKSPAKRSTSARSTSVRSPSKRTPAKKTARNGEPATPKTA